jgi:hypothetical protein
MLNHVFGVLEMAGFILFVAKIEKNEVDRILQSVRRKS